MLLGACIPSGWQLLLDNGHRRRIAAHFSSQRGRDPQYIIYDLHTALQPWEVSFTRFCLESQWSLESQGSRPPGHHIRYILCPGGVPDAVGPGHHHGVCSRGRHPIEQSINLVFKPRIGFVQFREVFLTRRYLGITMEYAAGGDMFDFFVRNKAFVNVKVSLGS